MTETALARPLPRLPRLPQPAGLAASASLRRRGRAPQRPALRPRGLPRDARARFRGDPGPSVHHRAPGLRSAFRRQSANSTARQRVCFSACRQRQAGVSSPRTSSTDLRDGQIGQVGSVFDRECFLAIPRRSASAEVWPVVDKAVDRGAASIFRPIHAETTGLACSAEKGVELSGWNARPNALQRRPWFRTTRKLSQSRLTSGSGSVANGFA